MASPNPEDELARLHKVVGRGLPPCTIVTGPGDHFRSEAMERLLAAIPKDAELRVLDAGEERAGGGGDDADDDGEDGAAGDGGEAAAALASCPELQELRGGGLFAKTAFLVVRRGAGWWQKHAAALAAALPRFGKGCGLVLDAAKLDRRKKAAQTLTKALAESGALFEFRDLYDQPYDRSRGPLDGELCKWVVGRSQRLGVALQPDAAWLLVMQVGKQPAELLAELQRLRDQLGADKNRKPLAPADLRGRLTTSFESTPFELADAVLGDDRRAALRSVRAMFDRGTRSRDGKPMDAGGVFPWATSWLYQQLATALEGRQLLDSGVSLRDVAARVGVRQFVDRFTEQVQRFDVARLRRGLLALHACQRQLRLSGEDPDVLLERFLGQWFDGSYIPTAEDLEL